MACILTGCNDWDDGDQDQQAFDVLPTKSQIDDFINDTSMVVSDDDYRRLIEGDSIVVKHPKWECCNRRIWID